MRESLNRIKENGLADIKKASTLEELEQIRVNLLGKKGELTQVLRGMGKLSEEERPVIGKLANEVREALESELESIKDSLKNEAKRTRLEAEKIDISISGKEKLTGHRHPLISVMEELESIFMNMGFSIIQGPEIETVYVPAVL